MSMRTSHDHANRRGGVYLAVLGTAMIAGVLAFSALALQRVQNRMLSSSSDIRQAQLNAEAAIDMGLLTIKSDSAWRTNNSNGQWFANRSIGDGGCALSVVDPLDGDLTDNPSEPVVLTGIGTSGNAVQRIAKTVDVYPEPLECLRSSVAAGGTISLNGATLRATNAGLVTANAVSASSSDVYGRVQATNVGGGTYRDTTTQVAAADLPTMPDWSTVFDYYQDNGTEIPIGSVPSTLGNFERNGNFSTDANYWYGNPPGVAPATVARSTTPGKSRPGLPGCLLVSNRGNWNSGACQSIDGFVKAGHTYLISAYVALSPNVPIATKVFRVRLTTKGTESAEVHVNSADSPPITGSSFVTFPPIPITAIVTAPAWSGDLEYAFIKIAFSDTSSSPPYYDFHLDDVTITDVTTGRFIYRQVLGPTANTITGVIDDEGIYWIDCEGQNLVIERSRIKGTLLLVNPGNGSMIGPGPIQWSPAKPGYPALLVNADIPSNADFRIEATNRTLSEPEDGRPYSYNPDGMSHALLGSDADMNDTFPSEIEGLIVVRDDLTFKNRTLVRGSVIVGDQISSTGGSLEVEFRPDSLYSPPPGFESTSKHVERPLSVHKEVLP